MGVQGKTACGSRGQTFQLKDASVFHGRCLPSRGQHAVHIQDAGWVGQGAGVLMKVSGVCWTHYQSCTSAPHMCDLLGSIVWGCRVQSVTLN